MKVAPGFDAGRIVYGEREIGLRRPLVEPRIGFFRTVLDRQPDFAFHAFDDFVYRHAVWIVRIRL